jgi:hypothetical protein
MVDYLVGRLSGVYMASSRLGAPRPDLAQFKPSTNNFEFLQEETPYPAEYTKQRPVQTTKGVTHLQDVLRIFEPHEKYKQGEGLTQSMTREFSLELARQAARNLLYERQPTVSSFHEQQRPTHFSSSNFLIPTGNESEIFGFRGHVCSKCLMIEHLAVSYSIDSHTGARVEVKHLCRPNLLAYNHNLDDNVRTSSVELMHNTLPSYLKKVVNLWTGEKVTLLALELPGEGPPTSEPTANDQIRIPYPRNRKILITFNRSVEKQVEINPGHRGTRNPNHWSSRVVRHGRTALTQHELEEFLKLQNATFGIYKIDVDNKDNCNDFRDKSAAQQKQGWTQKRNTRCYFMYISKVPET